MASLKCTFVLFVLVLVQYVQYGAGEQQQTPAERELNQDLLRLVRGELEAHAQKLNHAHQKLDHLSKKAEKTEKEKRQMQERLDQLTNHLKEKSTQEERRGFDTPGVGTTYTRWGRKDCPSGATRVYEGISGGDLNRHTGGGGNYQCLPYNVQYNGHTSSEYYQGYMYTAQYDRMQLKSGMRRASYEVPCAVCHVANRGAKIMIPARRDCLGAGWTKEYEGFLVTSTFNQKGRVVYECMDGGAQTIGSSGDEDGAMMASVVSECRGNYRLCKLASSYKHKYQLTCVVCTK